MQSLGQSFIQEIETVDLFIIRDLCHMYLWVLGLKLHGPIVSVFGTKDIRTSKDGGKMSEKC